MNSVIGMIFVAVGLAFNVLGCIGMIRLPDMYNRLQASTKCVTMGTCMVMIGVMISAGFLHSAQLSARCIICMVFILITAPTAAHALAHGAYSFGVRLWEKSVVNRYEEDFPKKSTDQDHE
ncbi:MAG: monovalent cation/H(+) antiporter subunit G [Kiritimatiellaeota bacterium]|nr:monovalent cation/H(+) antiporter subunit G [Kiritimatiellota bacterium]